MPWVTPKTDWQSTDYINFGDFNRIEGNILEVATYLASLGYNVGSITSVTNRTNASFDYISSINRIETNLNSLVQAYYIPPGWQTRKTWFVTMGFSNNDANRLENNTKLVMEMAQRNVQSIPSSGIAICGGNEVTY